MSPNLSDMWRPTCEVGAEHFRSFIEIVWKSRFLCVKRSLNRCGFRAGTRAVPYGVTWPFGKPSITTIPRYKLYHIIPGHQVLGVKHDSIDNGNWTKWSAIWSEIIRVIWKSNERVARVWFEITSMISDQNCTTRSSITTLLHPFWNRRI